jgi:hypothetical protein
MKITSFITLGVCLAVSAAAQMGETVKVTLPQATMVGAVTLPAGAYTIRDINDEGGSTTVVQIRSDNGLSVTAEVMLISEPDNKPANKTEVVLRHEGNHYQMDKIWFQGRDEGYELLSRR